MLKFSYPASFGCKSSHILHHFGAKAVISCTILVLKISCPASFGCQSSHILHHFGAEALISRIILVPKLSYPASFWCRSSHIPHHFGDKGQCHLLALLLYLHLSAVLAPDKQPRSVIIPHKLYLPVGRVEHGSSSVMWQLPYHFINLAYVVKH